MSTKHAITGGHVGGSEDGTHGRARRVAIVCACLVGAVLTVALLGAVARGAVASTTIPYVCINKSNGQLFYLEPCKTKSQNKVEFSTSEQFKACYLLSSGVTRKVSDTTTCDNNPRKKEGEILHVPDDEDPLYFCVGSDGTMYFKPTPDPTSVPTCPAGQDLVVIGPHNQPPVANNDGPYNVSEGGTLNVAAPGVLGNDTDPGDTLTAVLVSGPAHASSLTLNPDGSFIYVHDGGETTSDSFTYMVTDGSSAESNTATVSITVDPVNDAPVAANDNYSVDEGGTLNVAAPGVLGNDTDPDSGPLNAVLVSGPANASSFSLNGDGSFTYVHNGGETTSDSFTYKANDGTADSNVATVTITVTPVNDAPVANNDGPYNVAEGDTVTGNVLPNDTDAENDTLQALLVSGPANASSFSLNADGSFTYVHDGTETTTDSFTYMVTDGTAFSNVATVTITISPVDDAPPPP